MRLLFVLLLFAVRAAAQCPADWGYEASDGPDRWGQMHGEWANCDAGKTQAPLDITRVRYEAVLPVLAFDYPAMPVTVQHTGHELRVLPLGSANVSIGGVRMSLVQFHFHVPGEHALNGKIYPAEAHFVHRDPSGALHVVALFIEEGEAVNVPLQALLDSTPAACTSVKLDAFTPMQLLPAERKNYATYGGSLTTPPCTQPVTFYVLQATAAATKEQIEKLEVSGHHNARPLQPRGDRVIVANFTLPD